jgi:hypothetical protein
VSGGQRSRLAEVLAALSLADLADLADLALVCRAHHRAVHDGGWRLARHEQHRAVPPA